MELLIMTVIALLIIILSINPYISTLRIVSGEAIDENMKKLKQESWFKQYLNDDQYRELIIHNNEVLETPMAKAASPTPYDMTGGILE